MLIDWFVLLTPLAVLPIVLLFVFVGCTLEHPLLPTFTVNCTLTYDPALTGLTSDVTVYAQFTINLVDESGGPLGPGYNSRQLPLSSPTYSVSHTEQIQDSGYYQIICQAFGESARDPRHSLLPAPYTLPETYEFQSRTGSRTITVAFTLVRDPGSATGLGIRCHL